jgi:tricorn protease
MLRFPDVSASQIVFMYANDLWVVPRTGGLASPLSSPAGQETQARFSPDGKTIAFVGNYDGNRDIYTDPGGRRGAGARDLSSRVRVFVRLDARRPAAVLDERASGPGEPRATLHRRARGGLPARVPVPYGTNGAISGDGKRLAYTPHSTDFRTWKRYRGGMATDIWLFDLQGHTSKKMTSWEGTDTLPMWRGDTVYYLSDAGPEHRLNIWSYDTGSGKRQQVTKFADHDVKFPSLGPGPDGSKGEIVFQHGASLRLLDLATGNSRAVEVRIPGDRPGVRPRAVDASKFITGWSISPTGRRAVVEARGDLWTVPAKDGSPRSLTRTNGVAERDPAWSPDGRWIAYFSDATGEYELCLVPADGKGETRQLTRNGSVFRYRPIWSPDSKHLVFSDKTGTSSCTPSPRGRRRRWTRTRGPRTPAFG